MILSTDVRPTNTNVSVNSMRSETELISKESVIELNQILAVVDIIENKSDKVKMSDYNSEQRFASSEMVYLDDVIDVDNLNTKSDTVLDFDSPNPVESVSKTVSNKINSNSTVRKKKIKNSKLFRKIWRFQ